ncbi:class I SAM-dependent methyltransferase [Piscinibacter sakaiensis]|uniref:Methyltransferase type 11 domain-containing protein n=1 Tax=Piscinibacter sakaiensis TaxID=1547922 RepID=A0A0K8P9V9_PISS1|nr:class I SAM-dependent methyltransferase [Piscinibacter sakaiensis]GAP38950.1 hypothetical protein ISF6_0263 [Piscinibacter sakaiensis]
MTDVLANYYEKAFEDAGVGGTIYHAKPSVLELAGHHRKMKLLDDIDLPGIENAVVVDYGVGSWGFGCIFPKLKRGKTLIGFDISQAAINFSRQVSDKDAALAGKSVQYLTSSGYDIRLEDQAADIVFAGEVIEHIEDSEAFVSELCRITKPGGLIILTTPNEQPWLYKRENIRWTMGFEHVALMDEVKLQQVLQTYLDVVEVKGFTSSLLPSIDPLIDDEGYAAEIARIGEHVPAYATGLIVVCRRPMTDKRPMPKREHAIVESGDILAEPAGQDLSLFESVMGRMAIGENPVLVVPIPAGAQKCQLVMWSHPWSGYARIETAARVVEVDLYNHVGGARRISLDEADLMGRDNLRVIATGKKRDESESSQVIYFRSVFTLA